MVEAPTFLSRRQGLIAMNSPVVLSTQHCSDTKPDCVLPTAGGVESGYGWIIHPAIDLLFCCGGFLWILAALHVWFNWGQPGSNLAGVSLSSAILQVIGAYFLADAHNAATLVRLYGNEKMRKSFPVLAYAGGLAFLVLAACCMICPSLLSFAMKLYLVLIWHHLIAQAYGLIRIYCAKSKYVMNRAEHFALSLIHWSLIAFVIVRQFAAPEFSMDSFLGVSLPYWFSLPASVVSAVSVFLGSSVCFFVTMILRKALKEKMYFPLPALLILFTMFLAAIPSRGTYDIFALYFPGFFHSTQYIALTTFSHLKESGALDGVEPGKIWTKLFSARVFEYWGTLLFIGLGFYLCIPAICVQFGVPFVASAAAIFCAVNFHHFIADSMIWKLKNPELRHLLST